MIELTKYEKLFSTPLVRFQLADAETLNADLLAEGSALRVLDDGASKSNRGGWHSSGNLFKRTTPGVTRLRAEAEAAEQTLHERR